MANIKEWFENKLADELGLPSKYILRLVCGFKETEKAVYCLLYTGYDSMGIKATKRCSWIPKSCIENIGSLDMVDSYESAIDLFNQEFPTM